MTNKEKFAEVMNKTFDAGMAVDNLSKEATGCGGSPCGVLKAGACERYDCEKCKGWWEQEYAETREERNER